MTRRVLTVDDDYRMGEAGIFAPGERVELIEGQVVEMAPISRQPSAARGCASADRSRRQQP
jgi:hypothetical protein